MSRLHSLARRAAPALLLCALSAAAQDLGETGLSGVSAPRQAVAGQALQLTIQGGERPSRWCGLVVDFGDGEVRQIKVGSPGLFPVIASKTYLQPGNYTIKASGRRITTHSPCSGDASAQISVTEPARPRAAAPMQVMSSCPQTIQVRNAAGDDVAFGLRQMVVDAGGIQRARADVNQRLMDTQSKALDDAVSAPEREKAKQFAASLRMLREQLARCE